MDAERVDQILDRLASWGFVDLAGDNVRPTVKWGAKLQAAAEKINLIHARTGEAPAGNPLVSAVMQALANENLDIAEADFADHVHVLVLVELSRLTPEKRASLGFADVVFPGETAAKSGQAIDF